MYRLKPLQNPTRSYPNNYTTMLRNIVAGKVTIGPLNTSNSKIITNLNSYVELIAANAKIKRL